MGFVVAGVVTLVAVVLFLIAAALSFVTSAGDQTTWGWRVFRKLRILNMLEASRRRAAKRQMRNKNQN